MAMLASDREREGALASVHRAFAEGRLSPAELEQRSALALRARTRQDLARALRGLPRRRALGERVAQANRAALRAHATGYCALQGSVLGIWVLTGEGSFWPAWTLVPGSVLLGLHWRASRRVARALGWRPERRGPALRRRREPPPGGLSPGCS